jgi:hypothetical protein
MCSICSKRQVAPAIGTGRFTRPIKLPAVKRARAKWGGSNVDQVS